MSEPQSKKQKLTDETRDGDNMLHRDSENAVRHADEAVRDGDAAVGDKTVIEKAAGDNVMGDKAVETSAGSTTADSGKQKPQKKNTRTRRPKEKVPAGKETLADHICERDQICTGCNEMVIKLDRVRRRYKKHPELRLTDEAKFQRFSKIVDVYSEAVSDVVDYFYEEQALQPSSS